MTLGIAIATRDSVVLLADGRRSDAFEVLTDSAEKIVPLRENTSVIVFGATIGTDMAIQRLRNPDVLPEVGERIADVMRDSAFASGSHVLQLVRPEDRQSPRVKVGLLAGGIDPTGPFLAAGLYGAGMAEADRVIVRGGDQTPKFIVLGGEAIGAQAHFQVELASVIRSLGTSITQPELLHPLLLDAGERTIRFAAALDASIGGRIQWRVLQTGQSPQTGFA